GVPLTICLANIGIIFATTTTDANGNYTFTGLATDQYDITPNKTGYTFSLYSYSLTINGKNVTGINFTGTAATGYTISGYIQGLDTQNDTQAIQGITIYLGGYAANGTFQSQSTTSDS